jgi:hypothetical protein
MYCGYQDVRVVVRADGTLAMFLAEETTNEGTAPAFIHRFGSRATTTLEHHTTSSSPLTLHSASTRCDLTPITAPEATHTRRYAWDDEIQGSCHAHLVRLLGGRDVSMIAGYRFGKVKRKGRRIGTQGVRPGACGGLGTQRNGSGGFRDFHHIELSRSKRATTFGTRVSM